MPTWMTRFVDLREGEARPVAQSFLVLFLLIAGHTTLETARDALFLTALPPSQLNLVYIALAGLSFVVAAGSTRLARAFGRRNALIATLCVAAFTTVLLHAMTKTPRVVMSLYVFSGLVGAVLSPQFWLLAAQMFTSAQGRRLFGPIASGGVVGGVAGAGTAALLLSRLPVTALLLVAAAAFLGTALILTTLALPLDEDEAPARGDSMLPPSPSLPGAAGTPSLGPALGTGAYSLSKPPPPPVSLMRQPFVLRVALLVGITTAAVLTVDYLFKSTAARQIPPEKLGEFFARYYAVMNVLSLLVQIFLASRIIRRFGVAGSAAVTPFLLFLGGVASLLTGGRLLPVLATRMVDGGTRYSLNRVATELLYLPMPQETRERAKSLIDTVLARAVQAATAAILFGLSLGHMLHPRLLALIVAVLCLAWTVIAVGMQRPYLGLFRSALASGKLRFDEEVTEIDLSAAEALVEAMASPEPVRVIAAMNLLEQRSRGKLIPALILYHDDESVLDRALEIFGPSDRSDWIPLGERLLTDKRESVRVAAVRALAKHGVEKALTRGLEDLSSTVQAYAAFYLALRSDEPDLAAHPRLAVMVKAPGDFGDAARRILLTAIADAADPRSVTLVLAIAHSKRLDRSEQTMSLLAHAMEALNDPRFVGFFVERLGERPARDAVRRALVAQGEPALAALETASLAPETSRRVRTHIPRTIADFGTQPALDFLTKRLTDEKDGLVRYKIVRALGHIVASHELKINRRAVDVETRKNLIDHLQLTALRVALEKASPTGTVQPPAERFLVDLLRDKQAQALERAFRLLKIAHKHEDIHRVNIAALSTDRRVRSNAGEFLDTLLAGGGRDGADRQGLRELFRLVVDDLTPEQRVQRAAELLPDAPRSRDDALKKLIDDQDDAIATLASYYALSLGEATLRATVERAQKARPSLSSLMQRFFGPPGPSVIAAGTA